MSRQTISLDSSNELSDKDGRRSGSGGLAERLGVLFQCAADSGTVLTRRHLAAVLSCSDAQWDMAGGVLTDGRTFLGQDSRKIVLEWLADVGGNDDVEVSDLWVLRFMRVAEGLSDESLSLLVQACAHLTHSERTENHTAV
ncbi:hypothetical protein ACFRFQ_29205 [Rhodococcus sp. NPDC056743]|uniref:hypothetical protein n=1 Tax=Rhodococcus sp. NPDC056743 TaxID=3345934 RepID=UPI00367052B9